MSTNHSNTVSDWLDHGDMSAWAKRAGDTLRTVFEAIDTGSAAEHDYRKLTARGTPAQKATGEVLQKHFGKK